MAEIQDLLVNETLNFIDSLIVKAKVTIDGNEIEKKNRKNKKRFEYP